ncbi:MAG: endonuclease/exonuclease/phosphatase family protein [Bacillota bacterium]
MRKSITVLLFAMVLIVSFSYSKRVFSQEEFSMQIVRNYHEKDYIKLYAPTNVKSIYLEIYDKENALLAGKHLDYYAIERINGYEKNMFLVDYISIGDRKQFMIKLFPGTSREEIYYFNELETVNLQKDIQRKNNDPRQLKIMTFNIHHGKNIFGIYTLDDVIQIIRDQDVDIVGLQEVDRYVVRSKFEDQIKKIAQELNMYYVYAPTIKFLGAEYGNAMLSKYPIEQYETIKFPGFKESRGMLLATTNIDNRPINFLVTHLGLTENERSKQLTVIRSQMKQLGSNTILVGDFNTRDYHEDISRLKEYFTDAAAMTDAQNQNTFNGFVLKSRIDYIFVGKDFQVNDYKIIDTDISDHYPVIAELTF